MTGDSQSPAGGTAARWRMVAWGGGAALLLVPLVAMWLSDEVNWTLVDFAAAGVLIGGVGLAWEVTVRTTRNSACRAGAGVALAAAFMLLWVNGAIGIIGSENNPANLLYGAVVAVAVIGAGFARLRPAGMARAMAAAAAAQVAVPVVALAAGAGDVGPVRDVLVATAFFAALWLASAWLFRVAARAGG